MRITGAGSSVPDGILTNFDLEKMVDTADSQITWQGGIKRIKLPMDRVFVNVHKFGNTSAVSIPLALDEAVREGRINKGDRVILVAFGAGFTWGSVLIEW